MYTDFEKALDKVSHKRLINKLRSYGVNKDVIGLHWIQSFLTNRNQRVEVVANHAKNNSRSLW